MGEIVGIRLVSRQHLSPTPPPRHFIAEETEPWEKGAAWFGSFA